MYSLQYGMGLLHLLHGSFSHNPQLLHQNRDWVQAQAQDFWTEHTRRACQRGFWLVPRPFCALHLQICGSVPKSKPKERQKDPYSCRFLGLEWPGVFRRGTVLNNCTITAVLLDFHCFAKLMPPATSGVEHRLDSSFWQGLNWKTSNSLTLKNISAFEWILPYATKHWGRVNSKHKKNESRKKIKRENGAFSPVGHQQKEHT